MTHQINRILSDEYTTKILKFIFKNRAVKILRTIARTGRHNTSVPWVYYKNEITQNKFSTFISLKDLLQNFWGASDSLLVVVRRRSGRMPCA